MKKASRVLLLLPILTWQSLLAAQPWVELDLNGIWDFEQTVNAFPPDSYSRTIQVPGLVHLADPPIEDYDKFFKNRQTGLCCNHRRPMQT